MFAVPTRVSYQTTTRTRLRTDATWRAYPLKNLISFAATATLLVLVSIGCGGSGVECVGTVQYQGKTFEGKDKTAEAAKLNACNSYCRDADPEFDAMYRIWLDSPKGKAAGSPSKQESIFKDKDLLAYVTETCAKKCAATMNPEAKCGK